MTAHSAPAKEADSDTAAKTGLDVRSVAELVTRTLCGLHRLNGHFVRLKATLGDNGYIAIEVTRVCLGGEDATVRMLLHPTAPVPVTPQPLDEISPGPSAA
jgi:hypothetical protein